MIRIPDELKARLGEKARAERRSVSEVARDALAAIQPRKPPRMIHKRHPVSGCLYNAAPGQANPSLAQIKAALEDFP